MSLIFESSDYTRGGTQKDVYTAEEVVEVPCPFCQAEAREEIAVEHGALRVSRCQECGLIYTSTRIKAPEEVYWGKEEVYFAEARLIFEGKASHHRDPNYREELDLIERFKRRPRLLDVGCNMGMLIRLARQRGWDAVGVEPSPALAKLAARHGGPIHQCFLHEVPAAEHGGFDVVALSDVLEHIAEPLTFLQQAGQFLKPDGMLYIKVPNARWNLLKQRGLRLLGRRPRQGVWDSYEHVVHYTDHSLVRMLERAGYAPRHVTLGKPIQIPVWQEYVGHYYQYPSPWQLDWKRRLGRTTFYYLAWLERLCRLGSLGCCAPNIVALAASSTPRTAGPA